MISTESIQVLEVARRCEPELAALERWSQRGRCLPMAQRLRELHDLSAAMYRAARRTKAPRQVLVRFASILQ